MRLGLIGSVLVRCEKRFIDLAFRRVILNRGLLCLATFGVFALFAFFVSAGRSGLLSRFLLRFLHPIGRMPEFLERRRDAGFHRLFRRRNGFIVILLAPNGPRCSSIFHLPLFLVLLLLFRLLPSRRHVRFHLDRVLRLIPVDDDDVLLVKRLSAFVAFVRFQFLQRLFREDAAATPQKDESPSAVHLETDDGAAEHGVAVVDRLPADESLLV